MDKVLLAVKYVDGDLNEFEHRAFEDAVRYDSELQEYLASYREINRNVGQHLKEVLSFSRFRSAAVENEEPYVAEKITYGLDYLWFFGWALAAVIALLIWKPWKSDLYEEFGFNNKVIAATLVKAPYQDFEKAAQFLENKDYYEAKRIVSKTFVQNPEDFKLASYYAMLLIADNCFETGREILYPFAKGNSVYKNDATYMLALSYLKVGDTENCKHWLKKITVESAHYQQSMQLLNKLNVEASTNQLNFS
jgi:hypothetical protein